MVEAGDGAELALEAPHGGRVGAELAAEELDGDALLADSVEGLPDAAAPAAAEAAEELVASREDAPGVVLRDLGGEPLHDAAENGGFGVLGEEAGDVRGEVGVVGAQLGEARLPLLRGEVAQLVEVLHERAVPLAGHRWALTPCFVL